MGDRRRQFVERRREQSRVQASLALGPSVTVPLVLLAHRR